MADYGAVGLSHGLSTEFSDIDLGWAYGEYADGEEFGVAQSAFTITGPEHIGIGGEQLDLASILRVAQPWKGEGTIVEYLYIGGGISVY